MNEYYSPLRICNAKNLARRLATQTMQLTFTISDFPSHSSLTRCICQADETNLHDRWAPPCDIEKLKCAGHCPARKECKRLGAARSYIDHKPRFSVQYVHDSSLAMPAGHHSEHITRSLYTIPRWCNLARDSACARAPQVSACQRLAHSAGESVTG